MKGSSTDTARPKRIPLEVFETSGMASLGRFPGVADAVRSAMGDGALSENQESAYLERTGLPYTNLSREENDAYELQPRNNSRAKPGYGKGKTYH